MNYSAKYLTCLMLLAINMFSFAQDIDTSMAKIYSMSLEDLIDTKVTIATKSDQRITETPAIVSVITAEDIKNMGAKQLEDVLSTIPGFEFTKTLSGLIPTGIRGVSNIRQGGKLLILLDGTPYNDVMYGIASSLGNNYYLDAIERIEVIRGPGSALYGKNAFSGVVNIITKNGKGNEKYKISGETGSFNTYGYAGSAKYQKDETNAYLAVKKYNSDNTGVKFNDGMGGTDLLNYYSDNIYSQLNIQHNNIEFNGSVNSIKDGINSGFFVSHGYSNKIIGTYNLKYSMFINDRLNFNFKLYGRNERREDLLELFKPTTISHIPELNVNFPPNLYYVQGQYAQPEFNAYTYGSEIESHISLFKNNSLFVGLQFDSYGVTDTKVKLNYDNVTRAPLTYEENDSIYYYTKGNMPYFQPSWLKDGDQHYTNYAFVLQDVYYPINNLGITIGGRFDFDSQVGASANPRAGLVWEAFKNFHIKALYGRAYRAPTPNEQYKLVGSEKANENLEHEIINSREIAFSYKTSNTITQLNIYYNTLENLIIVDSTNTYSNLGTNKSKGIELEYRMFLTNRINSYFNASLTESMDYWTDKNDNEINENHPNIAPYLCNLGVNIKPVKMVNLNLHLRYQGEINKIYKEESDLRLAIPEYTVGDVWLLNSTIRISKLFNHVNLSASAYNILNQKYFYQDALTKNQPPQDGINYKLTIEFAF